MTQKGKNLTRRQMANRRAKGIRLLEAGEMTQIQIAQHLGISEAAVSIWKKKLTEEGPQALQLHKATGRPPKLGKSEIQRMIEILRKGISNAGIRKDYWTEEEIWELIQHEFGQKFNHNYIYQLLNDIGWRMEKPDPRVIVIEENIKLNGIIPKYQRLIKFRVIGRKSIRK
jgi:transposase